MTHFSWWYIVVSYTKQYSCISISVYSIIYCPQLVCWLKHIVARLHMCVLMWVFCATYSQRLQIFMRSLTVRVATVVGRYNPEVCIHTMWIINNSMKCLLFWKVYLIPLLMTTVRYSFLFLCGIAFRPELIERINIHLYLLLDLFTICIICIIHNSGKGIWWQIQLCYRNSHYSCHYYYYYYYLLMLSLLLLVEMLLYFRW